MNAWPRPPTRFVAVACGLVMLGCAPRTPAGRSISQASTAPTAEVMVERSTDRAPKVPTRREDVADEIFGTRVADPYRWLEDGKSSEVVSWIDAQNDLTERTLAAQPVRETLRQRIAELLTIGSLSLPTARRSTTTPLRLFYTRREGKMEQPALYVRDGLEGAERVLFDPNTVGTKELSAALDWYEPSNDGGLLAYGQSRGGSEDSTLYVRDVASGKDLPDVIERTRYASLTWEPDGKGFFYSRYPNPKDVPAGEERLHRRIFHHVIGQPPAQDPLVFGADLAATDFPGCELSPDGRFLLITVSRGFSESGLYLQDRKLAPGVFRRISPEGKVRYAATLRNRTLFVMTNEGAPRYRIFAVDPRKPERAAWRLVVPEDAADTIKNFEIAGEHLLVAYHHDGSSRLEQFSSDGRHERSLPLPTLGTSDGFTSLSEGPHAFFAFESFAQAPEVRHYDVTTGLTRRWQAVSSPIRSEDYEVSARAARSRDGTRIVYHLVHRRGLDLASGVNPTLLYGYGGFNESIVPRFSRALQAFLERGGVYVQALLRGGGEFGEAWHQAGQLTKKQNVFDDFHAVAETLINERVTSREHLAILGRSNGGLLVAAAVTQRPDLYRAAVAGVPLTDMIRYPRFLIGKLWVSEYGSPELESEFRALLAYSPYHRVTEGLQYPALLVTTAEGDTRVDPLHGRKFVAAVQAAARGARPILLRTERAAGHGAGTPVSKLVAELTDVYTFLLAELGLAGEAAPSAEKR